MRKLFYFMLLCFSLIVGCQEPNVSRPVIKNEDIINEFLTGYDYDLSQEKISFPSEVKFKSYTILLEWSLSENILDENGEIIHFENDISSVVTLKATLNGTTIEKEMGSIFSESSIKIKDKNDLKILESEMAKVTFTQTSDLKVEFLDKIILDDGRVIELSWSLSENILQGIEIIHGDKHVVSKLVVTGKLDNVEMKKEVGELVSLSKEEMNNKEYGEEKKVIAEFKEIYKFKQTNDDVVDFIDKFDVNGKVVSLTWYYDKTLLKSDGKIKHGSQTVETVVSVLVKYKDYSEKFEVGTVLVKSCEELVKEVMASVSLPQTTNEDIKLPTFINGVNIDWYSDDNNILTDAGVCKYVSSETTITISAFFSCGNYDQDIDYKIIIKPFDVKKRLKLALSEIDLPGIVSGNLLLKTKLNYDTEAIWESSRPDVISTSGEVKLTCESVDVVLKIKVFIGEEFMEKAFNVSTSVVKKIDDHIIVEYAKDFNKNNFFNVECKDGKVVLKENEVYGYYDSDTYESLNFVELVASWSALSSKNATCELLVKVKVNDKWSKYFSYGVWGLGRDNLYYNQTDTLSKMSVDEVLINNGLTADAFQYRLILRRDNETVESPVVSLVAVTIKITNYTYPVDVTGLPKFVDYDVPKVNQNVVPVIGNVICSATTSTMLLKYHGFNFADKDQYENRYIANLVADRGHNAPTYGNWVYNTVTIGAFDLNSYVKRMYSWEELKHHLATVGPVGATGSGTLTTSGGKRLYNTGGHLILVRGYRETEDGKTYVLCNDPNINERFTNDDGTPMFVYVEYPLEVFLNFWLKNSGGITSGITYIVENKK